jgi:hypothetical protein
MGWIAASNRGGVGLVVGLGIGLGIGLGAAVLCGAPVVRGAPPEHPAITKSTSTITVQRFTHPACGAFTLRS